MYARVATKLRSSLIDAQTTFFKKPATPKNVLFICKCRRITFERNKIASRLTGFIWSDSFSIILGIVGRFGVNHSGAVGPASLRRRNHVTSSWAMLSIFRSVLIVGYRSMTAMVILPWECGRHIAESGVQDRKSISRVTFGGDMS